VRSTYGIRGIQTIERRPTTRPALLILVLAAFLLIIGATASGQAALVSADSSTVLLNATVSADAAAVRSFVGLNLRPTDLQPGGMSADRQAVLQHGLQLLTDRAGILHAALLAPDGTVLVSDDGARMGGVAPSSSGFASAVETQVADAAIVDPASAAALSSLSTDNVLREYLPIVDNGTLYAVVAVWRDASPILAQLSQSRFRVVATTLIAALLSFALLFFIFHAAQRRLTHQSRLLVEAATKDPLTGAPNHGALVDRLAEQIQAARDSADAASLDGPSDGSGADVASAGGAARIPDLAAADTTEGTPDRTIGVALLDLDSFGLLDGTYGHPSGDHVLIEVVRLLGEWMPPGATWGRYGPDEFLVVTATGRAGDLEPAVRSLQATLTGMSLQFEGSERLPVTFSAGLCYYPADGDSVTALLSTAALTLQEAKSSGGDTIRIAAPQSQPNYVQTFNILEGLINAVDVKDRYTRHHSEDVARYGDFLAACVGLDAVTRRAIHNAGKLHDIGKIGIPDVILRKPGRLAPEEFEILQQHVSFGDAIVRDLTDIPDLELIRAGIRYHHERWDGKGYLDGMMHEQIPLVARVIAVADAFSAITTTRPYRKSIPVTDALMRIEDAATSQLDPYLTQMFVRSMRESIDAPVPIGSDVADLTHKLTLPGRQVA
jgi:diguanylate cyclase (GGDEF)-like protein